MACYSELNDQFESLDIDEEENYVFVLGGDVDIAINKYELCVVGRFVTERNINVNAMKTKMADVWRPTMGINIKEIEPGIFLFQFYHKEDISLNCPMGLYQKLWESNWAISLSVKPLEFKGEVDPIVAINWLKEMDKAFTLTQVNDDLKTDYASERSVLEYEAKFTELARLVPEYVSTEIQKARRFQQGLKPEIRRGVVALQLKTYSSMVQAALVMESDQKLAVKEESDKKTKSEGVKDKVDQGESSQEFENRFGRNRSKGFRRQSLFQARTSAISISSTPAQSVKSTVDCESCDRRHSGLCKKNVQCFKCGHKGHYASECNPENPGVTCYNCGKVGHIARSCRTITQDTISQGPTSSTARGKTSKKTKRSSI
ncbi:hypothetical protein AgCh_023655 [Apium graveolens]